MSKKIWKQDQNRSWRHSVKNFLKGSTRINDLNSFVNKRAVHRDKGHGGTMGRK